MYRRSKFLEVLIQIRQEMAREADFDVDLFAQSLRTGKAIPARSLKGIGDQDEKRLVSKKTARQAGRVEE